MNQVITKLSAYHNEIIEALPESLKTLVKEHTYFAGGCVRDLARGKTPNDYDMFFDSKESLDAFCKIAETLPVFTKSPLGNFDITVKGEKVQFITLLCGSPFNVIFKFDFTINSVYFFPFKKTHLIHSHTELIFNTLCQRPIASFARLSRFLKEGYTISEAQLLKMAVVLTHHKKISTTKELEEAAQGCSSVISIHAEGIMQTLAKDTELFKELC